MFIEDLSDIHMLHFSIIEHIEYANILYVSLCCKKCLFSWRKKKISNWLHKKILVGSIKVLWISTFEW